MKYKPMLAKIGSHKDLKTKDYIFEPKLDGYRAICIVTATGLQFLSRNQHDITVQFPEFTFRDAIKAQNCILDGEIITYNEEGIPNFSLLQGRDGLTSALGIRMRAQQHPATYVVFDILEQNKKSLIQDSLLERKKILSTIIEPTDRLQVIPYTHDGLTLWEEVKKLGLEGVMAKDPQAEYTPDKRTNAWLKIKIFQTADCIILGFTKEKRVISSLLLGMYKNKVLHFIGKVGTGFSETTIAELQTLFKKVTSKKSPLGETETVHDATAITWLKPKLVCEVKYLEVTQDGKLRNPSFVRIRTDKDPEDCTAIT